MTDNKIIRPLTSNQYIELLKKGKIESRADSLVMPFGRWTLKDFMLVSIYEFIAFATSFMKKGCSREKALIIAFLTRRLMEKRDVPLDEVFQMLGDLVPGYDMSEAMGGIDEGLAKIADEIAEKVDIKEPMPNS